MPVSDTQHQTVLEGLPGLDCGACGSRTCKEFAQVLLEAPDEAKRCIHLSGKTTSGCTTNRTAAACPASCASCGDTDEVVAPDWKDSLGREYDFILDTFPNEPGPRETMLPHNPQLTKEMGITRGDILIGRPLGMSCGCPITHCGVVMNVDTRTGVIVWCVTGPLGPRAGAHKDIGYYSAEAYEGLVKDTQKELKIGMRYWFLPRRCMLQWRHSGLINFINRTKSGCQVRIEGLLIG
jgi:uncharacterized Fe-S cluster-containing protein